MGEEHYVSQVDEGGEVVLAKRVAYVECGGVNGVKKGVGGEE